MKVVAKFFLSFVDLMFKTLHVLTEFIKTTGGRISAAFINLVFK